MGEGLVGVSTFHQHAHENIVQYFAAVTTETAQTEWERLP